MQYRNALISLLLSALPCALDYVGVVQKVMFCRYTYLLDMYVRHQHPALFVGPTGTGKSIYITQHLQAGLPHTYLNMNVKFSAQVCYLIWPLCGFFWTSMIE